MCSDDKLQDFAVAEPRYGKIETSLGKNSDGEMFVIRVLVSVTSVSGTHAQVSMTPGYKISVYQSQQAPTEHRQVAFFSHWSK